MLMDMGTGKTSVYTCVSNRWYQVVHAVLKEIFKPAFPDGFAAEGLFVLFSPSLLFAPWPTVSLVLLM